MTRTTLAAVVTAVSVALWPPSGSAQPADELKAMRKEIEALREGQAAIQKELQEIKGLLRSRPSAAVPAQEAVVSVEGAPTKGSRNARLTLIEFTDYQ